MLLGTKENPRQLGKWDKVYATTLDKLSPQDATWNDYIERLKNVPGAKVTVGPAKRWIRGEDQYAEYMVVNKSVLGGSFLGGFFAGNLPVRITIFTNSKVPTLPEGEHLDVPFEFGLGTGLPSL